jgi:hypothetical protein
MIRDRRLILLFLCSVLFLPVRAQSYSAEQIELAERLHSLAKNAAPELAYIQTSKDIYETGEALWFKVYLLDSRSFVPSLLSQTLYLQLINETSKKAVWQEKYEVLNGFANGQVYLDTKLTEGNYLLEAFTPASFFNDSIEFYAVRRIMVKTDIFDHSPLISTVNKNNTIQFNTFPEGGNLVAGIQNKLAFKAVGLSGEPINIKGTLYEDTTPVLVFKSIHAGMGSFSFTPDIRNKYLIRLSEPAIDSVFLLPEIYPSGITLQLAGRDKEYLSFKISQSPDRNNEVVYLRVQCRGVVYGMATGNLKRELWIKMPLKELPQGIAEVTLFNSTFMPLAERLVYINQDRKLGIEAELSDETFSTRGKVKLKISVKDEKGQPIVANLGVSIFDKLYQNPLDSNNILVYYYLSTQLKGRIYNPSFYFNADSNVREEGLDLLMLTQGWRKWVWGETNLKNIKEPRQHVVSDATNGKLIAHSIWKKKRNEKLYVVAYSPNVDKKTVLMQVDSSGWFGVTPDLLKRWEGDYVYLKPLWKHNYPPPIKLTSPFDSINLVLKSKEVLLPYQNLNISEKESSDSSFSRGMVSIPQVTIKGRKTTATRGKYMEKLDNHVKFDMNTDYVCPEDGYLNCPIHPNSILAYKPYEGVIYRRLVNYSPSCPDCALELYIWYFLPKYSDDWILKMNNLSIVKAYYANRKFYQPDYDKESEADARSDLRNTLLWEPSVITDANGEATLTFFCSDINSDFVGRIEGVGEEGLLGTGNFKLTVRKLKITP